MFGVHLRVRRRNSLHTQSGSSPPNAYSGATIRPALRGAKVKLKGGGAGVLANEGRRSLHSLQTYIIENKISLFFGGALCWRRPQPSDKTEAFRAIPL